MTDKICLECEGPIGWKRARYKWAKFCSNKCAKKNELRRAPKSDYPYLDTPTIGAMHELLVAADDLAALAEGKLIRVEVTTGYRSKNGFLSYPNHKAENFDVLAVVSKAGIYYVPAMSEWFTSLHNPNHFNCIGSPVFGSHAVEPLAPMVAQ